MLRILAVIETDIEPKIPPSQTGFFYFLNEK